jgi:hypothetical protein
MFLTPPGARRCLAETGFQANVLMREPPRLAGTIDQLLPRAGVRFRALDRPDRDRQYSATSSRKHEGSAK